jgi:hypothetical protein
MNITNDHLNLAWAAGLFDGEGSVTYKKYKEKKRNGTYNCWRIAMEVSMTDEPTIRVLHDILKVGTVNKNQETRRVTKCNGVGVVCFEMHIMLQWLSFLFRILKLINLVKYRALRRKKSNYGKCC